MDRQETRVIKEKGILVGLDKQIITAVLSLIIILFLATVGLWILGHGTLAIGVGAFTFFALELAWTLAVFALGAWWSFVQYQAGADIAIRSQESDDQRDIAMMNALSRIIDVVIKRAPDISPQPDSSFPTFDRPSDFAPALRHIQPPLDQDN